MKNRHKNTFFSKLVRMTVLMAVSVSVLTGCQLAEDEKKGSDSSGEKKANAVEESKENKDMFIGVFFSTEDLFADVTGDRIYAKKREEVQDGEVVHTDFTFENPDGIGVYTYFGMNDSGDISYSGTSADGTDYSASYFPWKHHDTEGKKKEVIAIGTININKLNMEKLDTRINVYAVYQTKEYEVYMTPSSFFDAKDGEVFSMSEDSKVKSEYEQAEVDYSCSVEASIKAVTPAERIILHQMDSNNKLIGVIEIDNTNVPESVDLAKSTEYVVVEECIGEKIINRYMVDMKFDDAIELYDPENEIEENVGYIDVQIRDENELFMNVAMVELKK